MKKSVVGNPIFWPGLVYSPINISGLVYALGTVSDKVGLLFEEFSGSANIAVCRKKTDAGWEKAVVGLTIKSSEFLNPGEDIDLLICWEDDSDDFDIPKLVLSQLGGQISTGGNGSKASSKPSPAKTVDGIYPEDPSEDLKMRGEVKASFEDTIKQLDERIKKLKNH